MLHVVTHKLWSHLLRGWVSDLSTATDRFKLVFSDQSSQRYTLSAVVLMAGFKKQKTRMHITYARAGVCVSHHALYDRAEYVY